MNAQANARRQSDATSADAFACLEAAVDYLGTPRTLVDIGCGSGRLVQAAVESDLVRSAIGIDIGVEDFTGTWLQLIHHDLMLPFHGSARGDLVLCWEVAEHLPESAADTLCDTVAMVTSQTLLFSAATPGQGGSGHWNEQPNEYWKDRLRIRGLRFDALITFHTRQLFVHAAPTAWWYGKNMIGFVR